MLRKALRRPGLAWVLALAALALGGAPWLGHELLPIDALSSAIPLVPALAVGAVVLARSIAPRLLAGAALLLATPVIASNAWPHRAEAHGGHRVVILTHNVSTANVDPAGTVAALLAGDADILLLQETNGPIRPALAKLRARFPYGSRCVHACSMMILSRWPTTRLRYRFRDGAGHPVGPALEQTAVQVPGLPLVPIVTLHLSRHRAWAAEAAERASLVATLRAHARPATVLGGDFNLTPWSAALRELDSGLAPLARATRAVFSWPARLGGHRFPVPLVPIDQVYAGPAWAIASVRRLPRTGSDHYPVRVELIWRG